MQIALFLPYYIRWHYSKGIRDLYENTKHILRFVLRFFSISLLLKTLFSPWKRLSEEYRGGFDPGAFFQTFLLNIILRVVGFVIRATTVLIGFFVFIFSFLFGIIALCIWILFPIYLAFLLALTLKYSF